MSYNTQGPVNNECRSIVPKRVLLWNLTVQLGVVTSSTQTIRFQNKPAVSKLQGVPFQCGQRYDRSPVGDSTARRSCVWGGGGVVFRNSKCRSRLNNQFCNYWGGQGNLVLNLRSGYKRQQAPVLATGPQRRALVVQSCQHSADLFRFFTASKNIGNSRRKTFSKLGPSANFGTPPRTRTGRGSGSIFDGTVPIS